MCSRGLPQFLLKRMVLTRPCCHASLGHTHTSLLYTAVPQRRSLLIRSSVAARQPLLRGVGSSRSSSMATTGLWQVFSYLGFAGNSSSTALGAASREALTGVTTAALPAQPDRPWGPTPSGAANSSPPRTSQSPPRGHGPPSLPRQSPHSGEVLLSRAEGTEPLRAAVVPLGAEEERPVRTRSAAALSPSSNPLSQAPRGAAARQSRAPLQNGVAVPQGSRRLPLQAQPVGSKRPRGEAVAEEGRGKGERVQQGKNGAHQQVGPVTPAQAALVPKGSHKAAPRGPPNQPGGKRRKKHNNADQPEFAIRREIVAAVRTKQPGRALMAYDRAQALGLVLKSDVYSMLLFLCAGGDEWVATLEAPGDPASHNIAAKRAAFSGTLEEEAEAAEADVPMEPSEVHRRGVEIFERLRSDPDAKVPEIAYIALARMAAANNDPEGALAITEAMLAAGHPPRLRIYTPALLAFCAAGNPEKAFEVHDRMLAHQLDLTEVEFALLLGVCARGAGAARARGLLQRIGRELTHLSDSTLQAAEAYFRSEAAAAELGGGRQFQLEQVRVSREGVNPACPGQLQALDLEAGEWEELVQGMTRLSDNAEKQLAALASFRDWVRRKGPFGVVIDGANVALWGQNWEKGGFSFGQIAEVLDYFAARHPEKKPLLILHTSRTNSQPARRPEAVRLLGRLKEEGCLFVVPTGANDDWYWLYAAAKAGKEGMVVSNDEMRDHIFQLLTLKFFAKWKQRHLVRYSFAHSGRVHLRYPTKYTSCVQFLPESGAWMLPCAPERQQEDAFEGEGVERGNDWGAGGGAMGGAEEEYQEETWLCARPVAAVAEREAAPGSSQGSAERGGSVGRGNGREAAAGVGTQALTGGKGKRKEREAACAVQ